MSQFKLLNPVKLECTLSSNYYGDGNFTLKSKDTSFYIKGQLFGIIDLDISQSYSLGNPWYCQTTTKVIEDLDFFIKNGKKIKESKLTVKTNANMVVKKNIIVGAVTKDYPLSISRKYETNQLLGQISSSTDGNPRISMHFYALFSYYSESENQE